MKMLLEEKLSEFRPNFLRRTHTSYENPLVLLLLFHIGISLLLLSLFGLLLLLLLRATPLRTDHLSLLQWSIKWSGVTSR